MAKEAVTIVLKRVYDEPALGDGTRVLVEWLWLRGVSKERARVDLWLKEVAPSHEQRTWFGHDPEKFAEFRRRDKTELTSGPAQEALRTLCKLADQGPLMLVFVAHDREHTNSVVLHDLLTRKTEEG